jgi:hypothetical protein
MSLEESLITEFNPCSRFALILALALLVYFIEISFKYSYYRYKYKYSCPVIRVVLGAYKFISISLPLAIPSSSSINH